MRIGVVSDTHDRTDMVAAALDVLRGRGVDMILHCGDIESPATVKLFAGTPTHFVFGNWDGYPVAGRRPRDQSGRDFTHLRTAIAEIGGTAHEPWGDIEVAGTKIAWVHGDNARLVSEIELMDYFDFLFYGHTHVAEQHRVGRTLVVNPGALFRARPKRCAVLSLPDRTVESVIVPG
jgi:putative phosphoesterase